MVLPLIRLTDAFAPYPLEPASSNTTSSLTLYLDPPVLTPTFFKVPAVVDLI